MSHFISIAWLFLLNITSNARMSVDSAFLKFFPCLLGPAPLMTSTLSSHQSQVYYALKTGGEPWRSFFLETFCRMLQKAGVEIKLVTLLFRSDSGRRTALSLASWNLLYSSPPADSLLLVAATCEEGKRHFLKCHTSCQHLYSWNGVMSFNFKLVNVISETASCQSSFYSVGDRSLCCLSGWGS